MPAHIREAAMTYIEEGLHNSPLLRIPGKTKQLKGRLAGVFQYDLPSGYRLWYRVDQETRTVTVLYIGPHP
jgi:mRNA-degrading endonuclease RelE of RelBE toxin-antitoxin system